MFMSIDGRACVAPELDDDIWAVIPDGERQQDPKREGVAVVVDVDTVFGAGAGGTFQQVRQ